MKKRLHFLDWLRFIAISAIVLYHVFLIFTLLQGDASLIVNDQQSSILTALAIIIPLLALPLLFFVSGASTQLSLNGRTKTEYIKNRVKRLLVPFLVGIITIVPFQYYFSYLQRATYNRFIEYYSFTFPFSPRIFVLYGSHLWFLAYLFLFSLLALLLVNHIKKIPLEKICKFKGSMLLLVIPLIFTQILRLADPKIFGWGDFMSWLIIFIYGIVLFSNKKILDYIERDWVISLFTGIVSVIAILTIYFTGYFNTWLENPVFSSLFLLTVLFYSTLIWSSVIVLIYLSKKFLQSPLLKEVREAGLPIYILHQPVIIAVGYYVVQWSIHLLLKLIIIGLAAVILTPALYLIVRRIKILRVLFGMKTK